MCFAVNLKGTFICCQEVVKKSMLARKQGKIINISSTSGATYIRPLGAAYHLSKAGVIQLTKCLANELAPYGIIVNSIAPGSTITPLSSAVLSIPQNRENIEQRIPMGRVGVAEDHAGAAVFLASEEANYITGQTIFIDGGALTKL